MLFYTNNLEHKQITPATRDRGVLPLLTVAVSASSFAECFTNYLITHTMPFLAQSVPSEQHNVKLSAYQRDRLKFKDGNRFLLR